MRGLRFHGSKLQKHTHVLSHRPCYRKEKSTRYNSWRRDMTLTTASTLPSTCDTLWKRRGRNVLYPSPNVIFWKYPAGCIDPAARSETEAVVWSHCHIIKVCRVLNTWTINDWRRLAPPTNTVISSGYTDWHHWRACALCRSVTNVIEGYQWGRLVEIRSQHSEVQVKKQSWPWMSKDTAAWAHPWKKWAHVLAIKAVDQRKRFLVFAASRSKWSFAWNPSLVRSFAISYKINTIGFFRPFFAPSLVDSVSHWQSCEIFLPSEDSQTLPFCLSEKEEFALYVNMSPWKWL